MRGALNPVLFSRLEKTFRYVGIVNPGVPIQIVHKPDWLHRNGRLRAEVITNGETYKVDCPFCTDTRTRLCICHRWSVEDEKTRDDMLHLVKCFNEDCVASRPKQKELHAMVFPNGRFGRDMQIQVKPVEIHVIPSERTTFELPEVEPLSELPERHPAIRYLRKRRFRPDVLERKWGVAYCDSNNDVSPPFWDRRIVIPVYSFGPIFSADHSKPRLAGWQARMVDASSDADVRKYLSALGMKRNHLLYGITKAAQGDGPVVVVEGITDVWRMGKNAVALFGKTISDEQCNLLHRHFADRPIVVFLDRDATTAVAEVRRRIQNKRTICGGGPPVVIANVPDGRDDPGDCRRDEAWEAVRMALES